MGSVKIHGNHGNYARYIDSVHISAMLFQNTNVPVEHTQPALFSVNITTRSV